MAQSIISNDPSGASRRCAAMKPFSSIGDVHGCDRQLALLLEEFSVLAATAPGAR